MFLKLIATAALMQNFLKTKNSDVGLNTVELIEKYNYPVEMHYVKTDDGYIIGLQRIPHGKFWWNRRNMGKNGSRPAVLLVHGLASSSANYVLLGPGLGLAYVLADAGYDVWISNCRGTIWSRNHTQLDVKSAEFWNFSWHEIGHYDNPAIIDYILWQTGQEDIFYVGHSQGGLALLVMASTRPEYVEKIRFASLLAPAYLTWENFPQKYIRMLIPFENEIYKFLKTEKIYAIPFISQMRKLMLNVCKRNEFVKICEHILYTFVGRTVSPESYQVALPLFLSNDPAQSSVKQFIHFAQMIRTSTFAEFDFGFNDNMKVYGTDKPPVYNLSKVDIPISIYYGETDQLVSPKDIKILISRLPHVVKDAFIPYKSFNHIDFFAAANVLPSLFNEILNDFENFV